jgi:hypothetical protein
LSDPKKSNGSIFDLAEDFLLVNHTVMVSIFLAVGFFLSPQERIFMLTFVFFRVPSSARHLQNVLVQFVGKQIKKSTQ